MRSVTSENTQERERMFRRKPTIMLRLITELQYYNDGSCEVMRSFSIPVKKNNVVKRKRVKNIEPAKDEGQFEL